MLEFLNKQTQKEGKVKRTQKYCVRCPPWFISSYFLDFLTVIFLFNCLKEEWHVSDSSQVDEWILVECMEEVQEEEEEFTSLPWPFASVNIRKSQVHRLILYIEMCRRARRILVAYKLICMGVALEYYIVEISALYFGVVVARLVVMFNLTSVTLLQWSTLPGKESTDQNLRTSPLDGERFTSSSMGSSGKR